LTGFVSNEIKEDKKNGKKALEERDLEVLWLDVSEI
jgi:hypothetical protein